MHTVFLHELHGFSKYYHYRSRNTENGRRNCYESNRNRAPDRRLGYNRDKVRNPIKHWRFADFVQFHEQFVRVCTTEKILYS